MHFLGDEAALDASGNPLTLPPATWPLLGCLLIAPHRRMAVRERHVSGAFEKETGALVTGRKTG